MHIESYQEMARLVRTYLKPEQPLRILDVGSSDVNGSYRPLFQHPGWRYEGADVEVWVVDNSERADEAERLRTALDGRCHVQVNERNVGFGAGPAGRCSGAPPARCPYAAWSVDPS
ncbi:MAG: hypothetical protein KKA73_04770 [Chloroflexi bacterium]|nr:hypothetical protein [Chloroflexota bacterium]MBU1746980.1 hypothetical protein [Chloroflexota bacterium]MBU1878464.1 hypothetical protein [Chloroflexota bacterium]